MIKKIGDSWPDFDLLISGVLKQNSYILEIGGGANPCINAKQVEDYNIKYFVQDIDVNELSKSQKNHYTILPIAICDVKGQYDVIISRMVLEHIPDPDDFHKCILKLCHSNTVVIHFFATLYNVASVSNSLLPDSLSARLQHYFVKRDLYHDGKFKAYYRRCLGPTAANNHYFKAIGYEVISYTGYSGHNYFYRWQWLYALEKSWSKLIVKSQSPYLCSNAIVVLKKG